MGLLTTRSTRRLATVGGLLTLTLVAGAAPAVAASHPESRAVSVSVGSVAVRGRSRGLLRGARSDGDPRRAGAARRAPDQDCPPAPHRSAGYARSAAAQQNWGEPTRVEEFDGTRLGSAWNVYDGPGHAGNGGARPPR
jgi:hypothetical protein